MRGAARRRATSKPLASRAVHGHVLDVTRGRSSSPATSSTWTLRGQRLDAGDVTKHGTRDYRGLNDPPTMATPQKSGAYPPVRRVPTPKPANAWRLTVRCRGRRGGRPPRRGGSVLAVLPLMARPSRWMHCAKGQLHATGQTPGATLCASRRSTPGCPAGRPHGRRGSPASSASESHPTTRTGASAAAATSAPARTFFPDVQRGGAGKARS